jgi:hypothetical protein
VDVLAGQPAEAGHEDAGLVQRRDHGQVVLLAQLEVLGAAAGGDVDDAGALGLAHLIPGDDAVGLAVAGGLARGACARPAAGSRSSKGPA